ncbi:hypothetical protein HOLleu_15919 [Holothuria leucospilota]|uniref:Uncharacterized protein n=1 Tax=Holothuria leucospilota TaxID=206669 RepID=A0A9Q1C4Z4_HOLLE|nr:hypothetical protein HOLleu_15919 [Holothuria leucospilota]
MDQMESENPSQVVIPTLVVLPTCAFVIAFSGFLVKKLCDTWDNNDEIPTIYYQSDNDSTDVDQPFSTRWEEGRTNFVIDDVIEYDVHEHRRRVLEWSLASWTSVTPKMLSEATLTKVKASEDIYSMDGFAGSGRPVHDVIKEKQDNFKFTQAHNEVGNHQLDSTIKLNDVRLLPQSSYDISGRLRMRDAFSHYDQECSQSPDDLVNSSPAEPSITPLDASLGVSNFSTENNIDSDITKREENARICSHTAVDPATVHGNVSGIYSDNTALDFITDYKNEEQFCDNLSKNETEIDHGKKLDVVKNLGANQEHGSISSVHVGKVFEELQNSADIDKLPPGRQYTGRESVDRIYSSATTRTSEITSNTQPPSHYASQMRGKFKEISSNQLPGQQTDKLLSTEMICSSGLVRLPSNKGQINPRGVKLNLNVKDGAICDSKRFNNEEHVAAAFSASNLKQHQLDDVCCDITTESLKCSSQKPNVISEVPGTIRSEELNKSDKINGKASQRFNTEEQNNINNVTKLSQTNADVCRNDAHDYGKENELRGSLSETVVRTQRGGAETTEPVISETPRVSLGGKVFSVQILSRKSPSPSLGEGASLHSDFPELVINCLSANSDGSEGIDKSLEDFSETLTPYFMFGNEILRVKITESTPGNLKNELKQSEWRQLDLNSSKEKCVKSSVDYKKTFIPHIVIEAPESEKTRFLNPLVVINGTVFRPYALPAKSNEQNRKNKENLPGVLVPVTVEKRSHLEGSYFLGHLDTLIPLISLSGNLYRVLIPRYLLTENQYNEFLSTPSILPGVIVPIGNLKDNLEKQIGPTLKRTAKTEEESRSNRKLTAQTKVRKREDFHSNEKQDLDGLGYQPKYLHSSEGQNYISRSTRECQNFSSPMTTLKVARLSKDNEIENSRGIAELRESQVNTKILNLESAKRAESNLSTHSFHPFHVILGNEIYKVRIFHPPDREGNSSILHGLLTSIASLKETKEKLRKDSESLSQKQHIRPNLALDRSGEEAKFKLLPKSTLSDIEESHISHYRSDDVIDNESPSQNIPPRENSEKGSTAQLTIGLYEDVKKTSQNHEKNLDCGESKLLNSSSDAASRRSGKQEQIISPTKHEYRNILESECYEDLCSVKENCGRKSFKIVRVFPNRRRRGSLGKRWPLQSLESIEEEEYEGEGNQAANKSKDRFSPKICETCTARSKQTNDQPVIRASHEPQGACSLTCNSNLCATSERLLPEHDILSEQKNDFNLNSSEKVERAKDKNSSRKCAPLKSPTKTENRIVTYCLLNTHERMTKAVSNGTINNDRQDVQSPQCRTTTAYGLKPYQTTRDVCAASINEESCRTSLCHEINSQGAVSWRNKEDIYSGKNSGTLFEGNISEDFVGLCEEASILYTEEGVTDSDSSTTDSSIDNDSLCYEIHKTLVGCYENTLQKLHLLDEDKIKYFVHEVYETEQPGITGTLPEDFITWNKNTSRSSRVTKYSESYNMDSAKRQKPKKNEKFLEVPVSDPRLIRYAKIGGKKVAIVRDPKVIEAEQLKALKKAQKKKKPKGFPVVLAGSGLDDDRLSVRSLPPQMSTQSMRVMRRPTPRPGSPSSLPDAALVRDYNGRRSLPPNLRSRGRQVTGGYRPGEEIYPKERSNTGPPDIGYPRRSISLPDNSNYQHNILAADRTDGFTRNNKQIYDVPHNNTNVRQQKRVPERDHPNMHGPDGRHTYSLPRTKGHDSKYGTYAERGVPSRYSANQSRNSGSLPPRLPVRHGQEGTSNRNATGRTDKMNGNMGKHPSNHKHPSRSTGHNPEEYERHYRRHMAQSRPLDPRSKTLSGSTGNFHAKPEVSMGRKAASLHDVASLNAERPPKSIETNVIIRSVNELHTRQSRSDHSERGSSDENSAFLHDSNNPSGTEGAAPESGGENEMKTTGANAKVKVETCFYWEPGFETKLEKEKKKEREEIMETEFTGVFTRSSADSVSSGAVDRQSFRDLQNKDLRALALMQEKAIDGRQNMHSVPKDQNRKVAPSRPNNKLPSAENEHIVMPSNQETIYAQPRARIANDVSKERPSQGRIEGKIQNIEKAVYSSNHRPSYNSSNRAQPIVQKQVDSEDVPHASVKETTFGVPTPIESVSVSDKESSTRNLSSADPLRKPQKMEATFGRPSSPSQGKPKQKETSFYEPQPQGKPKQKETSFYEPQTRDGKFGNDVGKNVSVASNPKQSSARGIPKWQLPGLATVNGASRQEQRGNSVGLRKETSLSEPFRRETVLDGKYSTDRNTAISTPAVMNLNRPRSRLDEPVPATQATKVQGHKNIPQRKETSFSVPQKTGNIPVENGELSAKNSLNPPIRNVGTRPPYSSKPAVTTRNPANQQIPKSGFAVLRKETSLIEPEGNGPKDGRYSQRREHQTIAVNGAPELRVKPQNMETSFSSLQGQNTSISKIPGNQQREERSTRAGLQSAIVLALSSDGEPSEDTDSDPESFEKKSEDGSDDERNTIKPSKFGAVRDATADEESNESTIPPQNHEDQDFALTVTETPIVSMLPDTDEYGLPEPEETFWPSPMGAVRTSEKQAPKLAPKPAPKPRPRVIPKEVVTKTKNVPVKHSVETPKPEAKQNYPRKVVEEHQVQNIPKEDRESKNVPLQNNVDREQSSDLDKNALVSRKPFSTAFFLRGVRVQKTVIPLPKPTKLDETFYNDGSSVNLQSGGRGIEPLRRQEEPETQKSEPTDENQVAITHQEEQQLISPLSISESSATTVTEPDSDKEDETTGTQKVEVPTLALPVTDDKERERFDSRRDSKHNRPIPSPRAPLSIKPIEGDPAFRFDEFDVPPDLPPPPEYSDLGREITIQATETEKNSYRPTFSSTSAERSLLADGINQRDVTDHQELIAPSEQPVTFSYKPSYSDTEGPREPVMITREENAEVAPNGYLPESTAEDRSVSEHQEMGANSINNSTTDSKNRWDASTLIASQSRQWGNDHFELGGDNKSDGNAFVQNGDARWYPEPEQNPPSDQYSMYHNSRHENQDWDQDDSYVGHDDVHNNYRSNGDDPSNVVRYYYSPAEAEVEYESNPSKGATMYYPAEMADEDFDDSDVAYSDSLRSSSMGLASYMHFEDLQDDNREMHGRAGTMYIPDYGDDYDDDYDDDIEVGDTALHYFPEHDMEPIFQRLETIPEEMEPWSEETSEYSEDDVSSTEEGDVTVDDRMIDTFSSIAPTPGNVERVFLPDAMAAEVGSGVDSESLSSSATTVLHHSEGDLTESVEPESQDRYTDRSESDNELLRDSDDSPTVPKNEREKKATDPDYLFPITDDIKVPSPESLAGSTEEENVLSREKMKEENESDNDAFIMEDDNYIDENDSEVDEQSEVNECQGNTYTKHPEEEVKPPPSRSFVIALVAQSSVVQRNNTYPTTELQEVVSSTSYANENNDKAPPPLAEEEDFSQPDEDTPVSYSSVHESPVRIVSPLKVNTPIDEEVIKTAEVIDQSTPTVKKFEEVAVKEKIPKSETEFKVNYSPVPVKVIYSTTATPQKIEYPSKVASTDVNPDMEYTEQKVPQRFSKVVPIQQSERAPTFVQVKPRETQIKPQKSTVKSMHLPVLIQGEQDIPQTKTHQAATERGRQTKNDWDTEDDTKVKVMPIQPTNVTSVSHQPPATTSTARVEKETPADEPKRDEDEPKKVVEDPPKSKDRSGKRKFRKIQGNHRAAIQDVIADLETNLGVEMSAENKQINATSRATVEFDKQRDIDKSVEESRVQSNEIEEQRALKPNYSTDSLKQRVGPLDSQQPSKVADVGRTIEEPANASSSSNLHPNGSEQNPEVGSLNRNFNSIPQQVLPSSSPSKNSEETKAKGGRISAKPCPKFDLSGLNFEIPNYDNILSQVKSQQQKPKTTLQSFKSNGLDVAPAIHQDSPGELLRTESGEIDKQLERMRENLKRMTLPDWFRKSYQYEKLMTGDVRSLPSYWSYKAPRRLVASSPSTPTGLRKPFMTISTQLPFLTAASFRWKDSQDDGRVSPANSLPDSWTFAGLSVQTCGLSPNTSATPSPNPNTSSDLNETFGSVEHKENLDSSPQVFNYSSSPQPEERFSAKSLFEVEPTPLLTTTQFVTHSFPSKSDQGRTEPNKEIMEPSTTERNSRETTSPPQGHVVRPTGRSSSGSAVFCITSSMLINSYQSTVPSNAAIDSSDHLNNNDDVSNSLFVSEHTDTIVGDGNYRGTELDIPESGGDVSPSDEVFTQGTMSYYNPSSNWVGQDFDQQQYYDYPMEVSQSVSYYHDFTNTGISKDFVESERETDCKVQDKTFQFACSKKMPEGLSTTAANTLGANFDNLNLDVNSFESCQNSKSDFSSACQSKRNLSVGKLDLLENTSLLDLSPRRNTFGTSRRNAVLFDADLRPEGRTPEGSDAEECLLTVHPG